MPRQLRRFEQTEIAAGTDAPLSIELLNAAGGQLDVTDATAEWRCYTAVPRNRRRPWKGRAILTKQSSNGGITLSTGLAVVNLTNQDLSEIGQDGLQKSGNLFHIIQVTDVSGNVTQMGQGELFVRRVWN